MTSNQIVGRTSKDNNTIQPDTGSVEGSTANSVTIVLNREDAFVTGALRVSEDSANSPPVSQDPNGSISPESLVRRSSLEALERAPSITYGFLPENQDAISIALPSSIDEELHQRSISLNTVANHPLQVEEGSLQEAIVPVVSAYASTIDILSLHLPHLSNVGKPSRHNNVSVTCYDYSDDSLASVKAFTKNRRSSELLTAEGISLRQHLGEVPSEDVQFRLIVASDLSTNVIECLGTSLSINPEVYEEHLVNSGWQNGIYNDQEPDTWITRDMKKSHMSIRWYRPVKRVLQRPYSTADRQRFLSSSAQPFSWTEAVPNEVGKPQGVKHLSEPTTNILRRDWDIKTDTETTISTGAFAAWEERATVWSKQCGGYRVAVLLLDPLPIVRDEMTGAAEALERLGVYQAEPDAKRQAPDKGPSENNIIMSTGADQPLRGLVKSSTFVRFRPQADQNFSIKSLVGLILGKFPRPQGSSRNDGPSTEEPGSFQAAEDPESGQPGTERQHRTRGISRRRAPGGVPKFLGRLFGRSGKKTEKSNQAEGPDILEEKEGTEIKTLKAKNRCMFEGLYPRGPAVDYDFLMDPENVGLLAEHLDRTKPTAVNLAEWLAHNDRQHSLTVGPTIFLEYLFAIIHIDTMNTLRHMELALQEIGHHILDDTLIQQRLVHWRFLLERFGNELQQLEDSIGQFAGYIETSGLPPKTKNGNPNRLVSPVAKLLEDIVSQINSLRQRTTRSHKSLMANMSIVESKRGIAEAESVTRLTELAFFFIPLTFSASIFSMQVKELTASRTSIAAFFILAIIITSASYALRLLIRSEKFIDLRRKLLGDIRHDAGLASGSSVPTKTFLAWLWRRIGLLTIIVTVLVVLLITPVAILWTRDMNHGFKVLLTILLLGFILAAAYVTGNAMLYIDSRGLHLRRDIFKPSAKRKERPYHTPLSFSEKLTLIFSWLSNRWFLIGLGVTGVGAGPSAALWTSQITIGIKVGVTIVIGIMYVGSIVFLVLWTILHKLT